MEIKDNVIYEQEDLTEADLAQVKNALKLHFIFSQLPDAEIERFLKEAVPCKADQRVYIFKQGDPSGAYYILLDGECSIEINGEERKVLSFGETFGDLGIIYNAPRSASILALTECYLVQVRRMSFKKVMRDIASQH